MRKHHFVLTGRTKMKRRQFLGATASIASTLMIVPRHVLGGAGYVAPSDKLNIAGIGVGGQGGSDLRNMQSENMVALCDVDWNRAAGTFQLFPEAARYKDFRIMLEKENNIEAVVVATPDHVHAAASMMAVKMGKHVYCEKPLTYSITEARTLTEAAREAGVATQMGIQGHAMDSIRLLCEWIWDGAIGDVEEVHAWTPHPVWPQGIDRPTNTPPVPATLDWDLWLGPAPYRPYHPCYLPQLWRGWWDFGSGGLGDMGCHIFDHIVWSLKLGPPISVEASHSWFVPNEMTWDKPKNEETYPRASMVTYRFPAREGFPPLKLTWYDGGLMPARPEELEGGRKMGDTYGGALYMGSKGKILCGSHGANGLRLIPESKMAAYTQPPEMLPRSIGHAEEWIAACKGGQPAGANFDYAGPMTETVLLGNIAIRTGEKLDWDSENMKITNVPEANAYLHRPYREGWSL
ncbi:Gfo/Idh/MocA family oxidoreductase [bacterium]|nr:Gfo/Idh/MocA family oxidoreductase [bacterium]RQV96616.1 MAG: gfo/Idh/MocA family oxidoreductase [bacterium]